MSVSKEEALLKQINRERVRHAQNSLFTIARRQGLIYADPEIILDKSPYSRRRELKSSLDKSEKYNQDLDLRNKMAGELGAASIARIVEGGSFAEMQRNMIQRSQELGLATRAVLSPPYLQYISASELLGVFNSNAGSGAVMDQRIVSAVQNGRLPQQSAKSVSIRSCSDAPIVLNTRPLKRAKSNEQLQGIEYRLVLPNIALLEQEHAALRAEAGLSASERVKYSIPFLAVEGDRDTDFASMASIGTQSMPEEIELGPVVVRKNYPDLGYQDLVYGSH